MPKLIVGAFRSGKGVMEFVLSPHEEKQKALDIWKEEGLEVRWVEEVHLSQGAGDVPAAVLRALASTPDGIETLSLMLEGAVLAFMQWKSGGSS